MTRSCDPSDLPIALNAAPGLSRPAACRLCRELDRWLDPRRHREPPERLAAAAGVPLAQMKRALAVAADPAAVSAAAAREREAAARLGARLLLAGEPDYPERLLDLALPPPVLYVRGELPAGPAVAVVGSRRADAYGREVAEGFARALAEAGVTVVSGFARGVDAAAHQGALAVAGGTTVAVLGCGLGVSYPSGHARLGDRIAAAGALVTELACGSPPRTWHFPIRNRIIAALAAGVVVVQAAPRSGSLITVRHALELGREVWAVPGRIFDEGSLGPHSLIRDGATLVRHPADVLAEVRCARPPLRPPLDTEKDRTAPEPEPALELDSPAREVLAVLAPNEPRLPEEIAGALGWPVDRVLGALLELEIGAHIRRLPGGVYGR